METIYNNAKGIDLESMVEIVETFIQKSPEIKRLPPRLRGYFQHKGKNAPRVVILVMIDNPKGIHWGGVVAAPVFREIAKKSLRYLNVPSSKERVFILDRT